MKRIKKFGLLNLFNTKPAADRTGGHSPRKMAAIFVNWRTICTFLGLVLALALYNEFAVYYVVILQCWWPQLDPKMADIRVKDSGSPPVRAMVLADTHLLGTRLGHWFDKLRREWQMERAFQSSMLIHNPEVVFILGDLFDEGKWSSDSEFQIFLQRFHKMFSVPDKTDMQVVVGNHDIGFHYMIDDNKRRRFSSSLSAPSVKKVSIRDNSFVLLNSMAFEGDGCDMCRNAENRLKQISHSLTCSQGKIDSKYCKEEDKYLYTRPIVMQHFPMYRKSDSNCTGPDAAPPSEINIPFKAKWDCLSSEASKMIFEKLKPRLIISGHTHNFCHRLHDDGTPEWTVPSFSWRNKNNPSFILMTVSNNNFAVKKCFLPNERTVVWTYIIGGTIILLWLLIPKRLYNSGLGVSNKAQ